MSNKGTHWRIPLGVGLVYALTLTLMILPAPLQLSHRLLGNSMDTWVFYWNDWWLERAMDENRDWLFTPYLFYPQGVSLVTHSNSFLNSLLALPLRPVLGPVTAYNTVLLLGLWISAIAMFSLVYELTHHASAALLAGFAFALAPYHLTQALAHGNLGSIHWWPLYALFLHRALRGRRVANALYAGFFAALSLWSGFHLVLLLAVWTVPYVVWHLLQMPDSRTETGSPYLCTLGVTGLVGVVTLVLGAPVVLPVVRDWHQITDVAAIFHEGTRNQTDLLAYLLPPSYHPLAGPYVQPFYENFETNATYMPYLGYTVLGLALISLLSRQKETWFWALGAGLWVLLAAGSTPRLNGTLYSHIPLPYRLIEHLFPISAIRVPDRLNLLATFSLAVSAGLGAAWLARQRRWMLAPLVLMVFVEYLCFPIPMLELPPDSPFFAQIAREESDYGVVHYPMGYTASKRWLYYQTLHGKPLVEGHMSRYTIEDYAFISSQPLLRAFYQIAEKPHYLASENALSGEVWPISELGPALHALRTSGVRYILLQKPYLTAALQDHFRRVLPLTPIYEDTTLAAYDTAHLLPAYYDGFPIPLTPDVVLAWFDVHHNSEGTEWQLQVMAAPLTQRVSPLNCRIQLIGETREIITLPITLFETPSQAEITWERGDLAITKSTTTLPRSEQGLEAGTYHWAVTCGEEAAYTAPETLEVQADGHITYLRRWVNVRYDDTIRLQGYRWRTIGPELRLTLRWEALENPRADYKVFVHLLNPDGEVVEQYDAIPCNWQCPTSHWQAGNTILDQATVSLGRLIPGSYHVAVGLYIEETLERALACGPDGERYPDDYFVLPDAFLISADGYEGDISR